MPRMPETEREEDLGYVLPSKPRKVIPDMPWDLGEVTDDELMRLYSEFTQWANYLSVQATLADVQEEDIEHELKTTEALFMARKADDGMKLNDARALRDTDETIIEVRARLHTQRHVRKLTGTLLGNCERSAAACSRELTRRTSIRPHERRSG